MKKNKYYEVWTVSIIEVNVIPVMLTLDEYNAAQSEHSDISVFKTFSEAKKCAIDYMVAVRNQMRERIADMRRLKKSDVDD